MSDPPAYEADPETPTHRSRPSVITNASAIAESTMTYGSLMSGDGLARLSQFPPPPNDFPFTPLEEAFRVASPVTSEYSMKSSSTATTVRRALPIPPVPLVSVAPLNVQRKTATVAPAPPIHPPLPSPPSDAFAEGRSERAPSMPLSGVPSSFSYPSPHDWHDGSSSIANDPYGEAALSTSFITSLLSSVSSSDGSPASSLPLPPSKQRFYEPSVISNALTTDSTITYPPPKLFPPLISPVTAQTHASKHHDLPIQHPLPALASAGRATPDTVRTYASTDTGYTVVQANIAGAVPATIRSMSTSPSLQSLNSSTPLMQTLAQGDPILEEEEPKTATASGPSTPGKTRSTRARRASTAYSSKSAKSYVSSLVARLSHSSGDRKSIKQAAIWFRKKPLPPVPPLPNVPFQEIRKAEDALPLPDLVNRAQVLEEMLDNGQRPYDSDSTFHRQSKNELGITGGRLGPVGPVWNSGADPNRMHSARGRKGRSGDFSQEYNRTNSPPRPRRISWSKLTQRQRIAIIATAIVVLACVVIAIAVGVVAGRKQNGTTACSGSFAGVACNLDASCTCASMDKCKPLANSINGLIPFLNAAFVSNFSPEMVSNAIWEVQGNSPTNNCANQVTLIDVAPALDSTTSPNRTQWAQAALLWNVVQSENLTATMQMQDFIRGANWRSLKSGDGPTSEQPAQFTVTVSGYQFNFAAQTVAALPATFVDAGQPSSDQISRVNDISHFVLDRMYTFAIASSTQQRLALAHYWTDTLGQRSSDLTRFLSLIEASPVMLPFDGSDTTGSSSLASLLSQTPPSFPPPLACYPGLTTSQLQLLNTLETAVFGLTPAPGVSTFETSCFPNRPVYGVLDILQLRLPFSDSRTGVAKQAAVLSREASSRAVVYSGEAVSALPGSSSSGALSTDPRQYGTISYLGHVVLKYLRSLDVQTAVALVNFILGSPAVPPTGSTLATLSSLPLLEIAVFGSVTTADISFVTSSLTNETGGLFFGSEASSIIRNWTLDASHTMMWTENASAPEVVRDTGFDNALFNSIWDNAFKFFHLPHSSDIIVVESNVTGGFQVDGLFSP